VVVKETAEKKKREQLIIALLGLAIIALAALDMGRFFVRLDLSRNGMYSISDVSKKIARYLPEQASLTYYVSDKLAGRYPFPQQIQDMLGEYATYSGGKISFSVMDPAKSKQPLQLENLGIVSQQMQVVEKQEINLATVYSGIVIRYLDRYETLPFVSDIGTLEYDISSKIRSLVSKKDRAIGILLGDSSKSLDQDYRYLNSELQSQYRIQPIQPGADIPPDLTALFVIGNKDLDEYDLFPVDQFIMSGGKALFAVSAINVDLAQQLRATKVDNTAIVDMLAAYGARIRDELVLDSVNQRISFSVQANRMMVVNYPMWITVSDRTVAKDNPITARFAGLDLYWPSPLESIEREGVKAEALVSTSPDSWVQKDTFETNPLLTQATGGQDTGPRSQHVLALTLSGILKSFFQGKQIPTRAGEQSRWTTVRAESSDTRLVIVGDAEFASDMIQYTQASYNMEFLSNCAEWLGREDDLLAIKTRSQVDLRLNAMTDPARKSRAMLSSQIINVAIIPLLVVAFGVLRLALRRRKRGEQASVRETP
jgi:gliding-associated putative ABC transporter substrate-binding component GldG